jgi:hypothetical protein
MHKTQFESFWFHIGLDFFHWFWTASDYPWPRTPPTVSSFIRRAVGTLRGTPTIGVNRSLDDYISLSPSNSLETNYFLSNIGKNWK